MDHISIIIVHYNSDKDTKECLYSLENIKTNGYRVSVVVVDNGSKKQFVLPKSLRNKRLEVIRSEANLGFTGGNNLGIWYARKNYNSDYFLLLNNDTYVKPDFLNELYDSLQKNEKKGLICPKIYFAKGFEFHKRSYARKSLGKIFWYAGGSIDWLNLRAFHRGVDEIDRGHFDKQDKSEFATGCCMLIPREIVETVGLLDKRYFLYLEDVDYSFRVKRAGYPILFCPQSIIWHKNAGSTGGAGSAVAQYYQTRNRLYFIFKNAPWRSKLTALGLAFRKLTTGSALEKQAVTDLLLARMGKQPIL